MTGDRPDGSTFTPAPDPAQAGGRRPMTEHERKLARAFASVSFLPGTGQKRFARSMTAIEAGDALITEKQAAYMRTIAWRFRRQLPPALRPAAEPARPGATRTPNELKAEIERRRQEPARAR